MCGEDNRCVRWTDSSWRKNLTGEGQTWSTTTCNYPMCYDPICNDSMSNDTMGIIQYAMTQCEMI